MQFINMGWPKLKVTLDGVNEGDSCVWDLLFMVYVHLAFLKSLHLTDKDIVWPQFNQLLTAC